MHWRVLRLSWEVGQVSRIGYGNVPFCGKAPLGCPGGMTELADKVKQKGPDLDSVVGKKHH